MKLISSLFAVAMLTAIQPAQAATTDPLQLIYRMSGVRDGGTGSFSGMATVFLCTNFSSVTERLRFEVRDQANTVHPAVANVASLKTFIAATHNAFAFGEDVLITPDKIIQGSATIFSSTLNISCSAMIVDAGSSLQGVALHMQRFNPLDNSQE